MWANVKERLCCIRMRCVEKRRRVEIECSPTSGGLLLIFYGQSCLLPSVKSTLECANVAVSVLPELLRHTGA
jgi:hypothetical protein